MEISARYVQGKVPVTIMSLDGELDAKCYQDVIQEAAKLYTAGTRDLLIDMSRLNFMASSGLVALHSIAFIMRGEAPPDLAHEWREFRPARPFLDEKDHFEQHCKLLNPQKRVQNTMEMAGFTEIFEIFDDEDTAVASFG